MKKIIAILLTVIMTIGLCLPTFAVSGNNDGTGAEGGYTNVGGSTWDTPQQGYRFSIVDNNGTAVANAVDIVFSVMPSNSERFNTSRMGATVAKRLLWSQVGITPPYAVKWSGGPIGNGAAFKTWFLTGTNAKTIMKTENAGSYVFTFLSAADKALISSGKTPYDVCADKCYYITVEPITWFVPAAWNSTTNSISTSNNYGKYIYGTIYNICGWYKSHSGYGTGGGAYSNVLSVMWQSMYTVNSAITLVKPMSAVTGTTLAQVEAYADTNPTLAAVYDKLSSGFGSAIHVYYLGNTAYGEGEKPEDETSSIGTDTKSYPKDTTVITSVKLKNTTGEDIISLEPITVTFTVNGKAYTVTDIVIPKDEEQLVWIKWKTPDTTGTYPMTVHATNGMIENPNSASSADAYVSTLNVGVVVNNGITEIEPPDPTALDKPADFGYSTNSMNAARINLQNSTTNSTSHSWSVWSCTVDVTEGITNPTLTKTGVSSSALSSTVAALENQGYTIVKTTSSSTVSGGYSTSSSFSSAAARSSAMSSWCNAANGYTNISTSQSTSGGGVTTKSGSSTVTFSATASSSYLIGTQLSSYISSLKNNGYTNISYSCTSAYSSADKKTYYSVYNFTYNYTVSTTGTTTYYLYYTTPSTSTYTIYYKLPDEPEEITYEYDTTSFTATVQEPIIKISPSDFCETDYKLGNTIYMKSGYGTYIDATAAIKLTSSDGLNQTFNAGYSNNNLVGFQKALTYFPEFRYTSYRRLLDLSSGIFSYRVNKYSGLGDNSHFTPVWYPDNTKYQTLTSFFYAYTPIGVMRLSYIPSYNAITIDGNEYDDWHITHR